MSPFVFRLYKDSGNESWRTSCADETKVNFCRRSCSRASPTCLSDKHLHWSRRWALPDDVVARHDDLVASKFLQLCQNKRDVWICCFELSRSRLFAQSIRDLPVYSRVSSNSVSEALLTVLKVLLALQKEENKEELKCVRAWEGAFTVRAKYAAGMIMTMGDELKGKRHSIAVLRAKRTAQCRPVWTGFNRTAHGFFKGTGADRCVSASSDCNVQRDLPAFFRFFSAKSSFQRSSQHSEKKHFFIGPGLWNEGEKQTHLTFGSLHCSFCNFTSHTAVRFLFYFAAGLEKALKGCDTES